MVGRQPGLLHPIPVGNRPFETVHQDDLAPFVTSGRENKFVLAAICNLTKFVQLYMGKSAKSSTTVKLVEEFIEIRCNGTIYYR